MKQKLWKILGIILTGALAATTVGAGPVPKASAKTFVARWGVAPEPYGLGCEYVFTIEQAWQGVLKTNVSVHGCRDAGWYWEDGPNAHWVHRDHPHMTWTMFDLWNGMNRTHSMWMTPDMPSIARDNYDSCFYGHPLVFDFYMWPGQTGPGALVIGHLVHRQVWLWCGEQQSTN
jgi:hypothetical protein